MKQFVIVALSLCPLLMASQDAMDRIVGTWKVRIDKSEPPGSMPERSITNVISTTAPHTFRTETTRVLGNGKTEHIEMVQVCDGKEHASGNPSAPEATFTCDPKTGNFTTKRNGKVMMEVKRELSPDGKFMTFRRHRLDNSGKWADDVRVWERVQ
jgi:hypothetical protein